ncbi:ABC transporter related protein [Carbonactinospora thermoautotrophica]|uniref:ABC transporter related protein n=2 Tax=Carbonactinospora thermoautotrophica TaxID=1469144 RepID=A0A132MUC9_9ACTN|nr:sugar ABC transporter ATP-binding protein [Carbonactinospora thermoautotrophica]KWX01404.1 ABC transporter related protein [Carbonactinospora thermoautotrophica]
MSAATAAERVQPTPAFVSLTGASKAYGPIQALADVRLELHLGEVHCLAGENGAGKSTLIKILTGAVRRDTGEYRIDGHDVGSPTPAQARTAGIGVVYQELSLLPDLSVAENLLMGQLPARRGITRPRELRRQARLMLERVDLGDLDPDTPVASLSLAVRQLVEIAKVLGRSPRVLIFDEPTTALSESETAALLGRIRQLRDDGHAIMYVTHHLEEMFAIGDRVTVLRDGRLTTSAPMSRFDHDSLVAAMVGRKIESLYPASHRKIGDPRLVVRGLRRPGVDGGIDLTVRAGEILGVAGLLGSGRTELLRALFGADPIEAGEIEIDGVRVTPGSPRQAVRAGLGLLTEDRKQLGLLLELTIRENASIAHLPQLSRLFTVDRRRERRVVDRYLGGLRLRAASWEQAVSSLSGGNQQKVLLARWLATNAKVLLFDEPTKGVDVGAKSEIYTVIGDLAAEGLAVIVVSSYLPEVLGLADRILVMREGQVAGELTAAGATEEDVLHLASPGVASGGPDATR